MFGSQGVRSCVPVDAGVAFLFCFGRGPGASIVKSALLFQLLFSRWGASGRAVPAPPFSIVGGRVLRFAGSFCW